MNREQYFQALHKLHEPLRRQQPTKVHAEQPVLTNQDIETSNAVLAEVGNVFAKMGVMV
jgi:hypothetical protein